MFDCRYTIDTKLVSIYGVYYGFGDLILLYDIEDPDWLGYSGGKWRRCEKFKIPLNHKNITYTCGYNELMTNISKHIDIDISLKLLKDL